MEYEKEKEVVDEYVIFVFVLFGWLVGWLKQNGLLATRTKTMVSSDQD